MIDKQIIFPEDEKDIELKAKLLREAWGNPNDNLQERGESWKDNCYHMGCLNSIVKLDDECIWIIFWQDFNINKEYIERTIGYQNLLQLLQDSWISDPYKLFWIQGFYIKPNFRKLGIGIELLSSLINQVKNIHWVWLLLDVDYELPQLISWYKKQWFSELSIYDRTSKDKIQTIKKVLLIKRN